MSRIDYIDMDNTLVDFGAKPLCHGRSSMRWSPRLRFLWWERINRFHAGVPRLGSPAGQATGQGTGQGTGQRERRNVPKCGTVNAIRPRSPE
jgi:hypothetical protein